MVSSSYQTHTAAEIADALGRSRAAIRNALASIRPASCKIVAGNTADSWRFLSLPLAIRNELEASAAAKGYRNAEHLLSDPSALWQAEFSSISAKVLTPAVYPQFGKR